MRELSLMPIAMRAKMRSSVLKLLAFRGEDFLAGAQQGIEFGHKTGVKCEKCHVEVDEEAFGIGFVHLRVVLLEQVVGLFGFYFALDQFLVRLSLSYRKRRGRGRD